MAIGIKTKLNLTLVGIFCALMSEGATVSASPTTFALVADDGYGVENCLLVVGDCGQTVADAWCEAHGVGDAIIYGTRRPLFGTSDFLRGSDETITITCGD